MEIIVGNMVCRHCVSTLRHALEAAGFDVADVELGRAVINTAPATDETQTLAAIDKILADNDFVRIADRDAGMVDRIKHAVIEHVRNVNDCRLNLSACLSDKLGVSYDHASRIFSRLEGRTIEKYHIAQKIEYVKELIGERRLTLAEIADEVGYSSVAHLSRQFKDVTGMTLSQYTAAGNSLRQSLDKI